MDDSLLPFTSLQENLTQTHLDFSYFRTTEPKLLRLCARRHSQAYETPFGWATHVSTNQHLSNILYLKVLFHNNVSILNTKSTFYKQLLNTTFTPIMCHPHFSSISSFIPANPNFSYIGRPISVASKEIASIPLFFAFSTNNDSV